MALVLAPETAMLPSHLLLMQVLQLMQECQGATLDGANCEICDKLEKHFLQHRAEEMLSTEPGSTHDKASKAAEATDRSMRIQELDQLLSNARKEVSGLKNTLEHQRHKLQELERNVDNYKKAKLQLEGKLQQERGHIRKITDELQSEKNSCLEVFRDLASQKEYGLELAAEIRKEKHQNAELVQDLDTERQYNAELDVNCRDKKGNTALHRWATH
jgi:chromosome segregation ATPase